MVDCYLIKINANGEVLWQRLYGGSGLDDVSAIHQTSDGGYIVGGSSNSTDIPGIISNGGFDQYIFKIDSMGEVVWQRLYGGTSDDYIMSLQPASDGNFIAGGVSPVAPGLNDVYLIKLDTTGEILWQKIYGAFYHPMISIQQTGDGGYIVGGASDSTDIPGVTNHGGVDVYIIKLNPEGSN
jgi:hypothetical protein